MRLIILLFILSLSAAAFSQQKKIAAKNVLPMNIKQYWFVLLVEGPNRNQDSVTAAQIQKAHMANINRLYLEGKLKVAGPFGDEGPWKGLFIFDCDSRKEVIRLLESDQAILSGRLNYEIHPWYTEPSGSFKPGIPKKK